MSDTTTTVETTREAKGKLVVSATAPQPIWATWVFRIVFLLTTAAVIIIAGDTAIPDQLKVRLMLYLKAGDVVVWGVAKMLGIEKPQIDTDKP